MIDRIGNLISFGSYGWHKGFYNTDDITDALCKIRYTDFFEYIALKEAAETEYWLRLLLASSYISEEMGEALLKDCLELKKILIASINTAKGNVN